MGPSAPIFSMHHTLRGVYVNFYVVPHSGCLSHCGHVLPTLDVHSILDVPPTLDVSPTLDVRPTLNVCPTLDVCLTLDV